MSSETPSATRTVLRIAFVAVSVLFVVLQCVHLVFPDGYRKSERRDWHRVAEMTTNISYCDDHELYPNTYFDLYHTNKGVVSPAQPRPVFVYVHGGGYVGGSKETTDTSCMGPGVEALFEALLEGGCDVVSMDYTLASGTVDDVPVMRDPRERIVGPDCYPHPVEELALLMDHLREHAQEYGIDMRHVAVGGGSAGGQIAGQFAALCTNDAYRKQMISVWLDAERYRNNTEETVAAEYERGAESLQAVYLGCALLDPARFACTGDAATDARYSVMQATYFAPWFLDDVRGSVDEDVQAQADDETFSDNLAEANVIVHASKRFPPTYLTDGNYLTFDDQAREMDAKLAKLGVDHIANMVGEGAEAKVPHGYDVQDRDDARENAKRAAAFICEHLGL